MGLIRSYSLLITKRRAAAITTIQRWQRTNPWIFAALIEKAVRDSHNQLASTHSGR